MTDGQITNRDLYEAQRDTEKQLGGLALQVATLVAELRGVGTRLDSGTGRMTDFENRLRSLERFKYLLVGGCILGGALSGALASLAVFILGRH